MHRPPLGVAFDVMGEYKLELISIPPALTAQNPLLNPFATLNSTEQWQGHIIFLKSTVYSN